MSIIPSGPYQISLSGNEKQLATLLNGNPQPGTSIVLLPPEGQPGQQLWHVQVKENATVTIENIQTRQYLSYDGNPELENPVVQLREPRDWILEPADKPFTFFVLTPSREFLFDISRRLGDPRRTALQFANNKRPEQAWKFQFLE